VAEWARGEADRHDPPRMPRPQCATNIPTKREVWSCARDGGGPLVSCDQEQDANRCKLLPLRAVVVSVAERAGRDPALVRLGETSESKPSMNGRKGSVDVKTEVSGHLGTSLGGALKPGPSGIRLEGGVTPRQALVWNVGTCRLDAKGNVQVGGPDKDQLTDARHRDGAVRSRAEGPVMGLDRRGSGILLWQAANW
jgi:hypothetical protein